jgi:hypothetical protein
MTKDELIAALRAQDGEDPESDHYSAEGMLLRYINDDEISEAWRKVSSHWWYA